MHSNVPFSAVRYLYRKSSIKPPGGLFISITFDGGGAGGLIEIRAYLI